MVAFYPFSDGERKLQLVMIEAGNIRIGRDNKGTGPGLNLECQCDRTVGIFASSKENGCSAR